MTITLTHYLVASALLFTIGLVGIVTRRNVLMILLCIELMFNAINVTMVAFSRYITPNMLTGQVFAIFIITVAAAEAAAGLGIILCLYRNRETVDAEKFNLLKW